MGAVSLKKKKKKRNKKIKNGKRNFVEEVCPGWKEPRGITDSGMESHGQCLDGGGRSENEHEAGDRGV